MMTPPRPRHLVPIANERASERAQSATRKRGSRWASETAATLRLRLLADDATMRACLVAS